MRGRFGPDRQPYGVPQREHGPSRAVPEHPAWLWASGARRRHEHLLPTVSRLSPQAGIHHPPLYRSPTRKRRSCDRHIPTAC